MNGLIPLTLLLAAGAWARVPEGPMREVDIDPPPDAAAPLELRLRDSTGRSITLGAALAGRPALLTLGYAECPMLCSVVLNGVVRALRALPASAGKEFSLATVSIDPEETPEDAARLRAAYLKRYRRDGADWRFLTGGSDEAARLARALGFRYARDPATGEYAHAAALFVLAPDGRLARVLYGVEFSPRDVRLALAEAAEGRRTLGEKVLLYCYDYDPAQGRYGPAIFRVLRASGAATALGLLVFVAVLKRRERAGP